MHDTRRRKRKKMENSELWTFLKFQKSPLTVPLLLVLLDQSLNHFGKV